jgi:hypothetical protein
MLGIIKFIKRAYGWLFRKTDAVLVGLVFTFFRILNRVSSPNSTAPDPKFDSFVANKILVIEPTAEILRFLKDNESKIDQMFKSARQVTKTGAPVRVYDFTNEDFDYFSRLISDELKQMLKKFFRNEVCCMYACLLEYLPYDGEPDNAHLWHTDYYPLFADHLKYFYYLEDSAKENGAFEYYGPKETQLLLSAGFSPAYPGRKAQPENVIKMLSDGSSYKYNVLGGPTGASFIFNPSTLVHRAGPILKKRRRALSFEFMPGKKNCPKFIAGGMTNREVMYQTSETIKYWTS